MKDSNNTSLTIRTKVASNLNSSISSLTPLVRTNKFGNRHSTGTLTTAAASAGNPHNNSDDEFELPLGNLIIDLDADIEKSNERFSGENSESHHFATAGNQPPAASGSASNSLSNAIANSTSNQSPTGSSPFEAAKAMSTSKTIRDVNNGTTNSNSTQQQNNQSNSATQSNSLSNSSAPSGGKSSSSTNIQPLTVDKRQDLKLKIKRKNTGGKSSESKLEVVQSDTNPRHNSSNSSSSYGKSSSSSADKNGLNLANNGAAANSATNEVEKIKHSSSKSKNSSHKEKKEKKDKADKNSSNSSSAKNSNDAFAGAASFNNSETAKERNPIVLNFDKKALNQSSASDHHHTFNQLKKDADESVDSPPFKKSKNDNNKNTQPSSSSLNHCTNSTNKPEMRTVSTGTDMSTMTEPECLGYCEPGSSICLEGITWVETEGVLVVNVTWRGKSYVGTLLDASKHDWGPPHPRSCDSPTSDLESKGLKSGRGKRARSSISEQDSRLWNQSKLRNGKGRRNNFTVPASPLKVDQNNKRNRNGKDADKAGNSSQPNSRNTPTPTPLDSGDSLASSPLAKQPSSPVFIECPEPTCSKKYRHINGLKYHQTHSHSGTKTDDLEDTFKEPTDVESMEVESLANSPQCKATSDNNCNETNSVELNSANSSESVDSKKSKQNCDKTTKNSDNEAAHSPVYSDISDAGENGNESSETSNAKGGSHSTSENRKIKQEKTPSELNNGDPRKESDLARSEDLKPAVKEEHKTNSDKEAITANNGVLDKNGLSLTNSNPTSNSINSAGIQPPPTLINAGMNPNFQFPFNVLPHNPHLPHLPFPMEEDPLDAHRMRSLEEYKKQMAGLKGFGKADQMHAMNELKQQHQQSQFKTPPLSTSISPQSQQQQPQQPPTSTHSSIFNQQPQSAPSQQSPQNKPSSPYDFVQNEKQQAEMLKQSGRRSEERFSLSSNRNQLGNLSSPKQQPSSGLFGQQPNNTGGSSSNSSSSNHKDESQRTAKQVKQEEGIKPTMETTGPPPAPINHSFYHSMSPFLGAQVFPGGLPFDPSSSLFRAQQAAAAAANPFNQPSFMNNLRYPNPLAPQLPPGLDMRPNLAQPSNLPGQEMNNKLMNANGNNKKAAFEMLQQYSMQDKLLSSQSPNSAMNKNGLPPVSMSNPVRHSPSGQLGNLANAMRKEENLSPQRLHHPGIPPHPTIADPFGALIKNAVYPKR